MRAPGEAPGRQKDKAGGDRRAAQDSALRAGLSANYPFRVAVCVSMLLSRGTESVVGRGLFSGVDASVRFTPTAALTVRRADADAACELRPSVARTARDGSWAGLPAGVPVRNTTIEVARGVYAGTVEHALSAAAGLGAWACAVELRGVEAPIGDGSAKAFVDVLRPVLTRGRAAEPVTIGSPVEVRHERTGAVIRATPCPPARAPVYMYRLVGGVLEGQSASWRVGDAESYITQIAPARTFSFEAEARAARAAGLFPHLTTRDMLVLRTDGSPIDNMLRFPDEPARHKLLDLIGDLALLGGPLWADVEAVGSGHAMAHDLCRAARKQGEDRGVVPPSEART